LHKPQKIRLFVNIKQKQAFTSGLCKKQGKKTDKKNIFHPKKATISGKKANFAGKF